MPRIADIVRNEEGQVIGAVLDDGRVVSMDEVMAEVKKGNIAGVTVDVDRQGREYLREDVEM
ncbi:DUF3892 domain-containing protein [Syntrophothermus lipocalidus]|uniref:Uncharacterized protein n=1 Tax=Syntrophothermus lipocalidus (strain DSM 12680 / TGB-C1) TaxID=643648 RepID=D7CMV0_SYNLT|nr:DUF3892 domain-containing protein [Syntrophothermus lipocalidus]ADI02035.1 conserved hypothetical protein [Syntrophothermus lipocalidus DSM 12680]